MVIFKPGLCDNSEHEQQHCTSVGQLRESNLDKVPCRVSNIFRKNTEQTQISKLRHFDSGCGIPNHCMN
jgi:hypothetical protein